MTLGTWTTQNKIRPGAYINFRAVTQKQASIGNRGVVTIPIALDWGVNDEIIELLSTDLIDGKATKKLGYDFTSEKIQPIVKALQHCYKALIYRVDTGGTQATKTLGDLTVTAKYAGILGNKISVSIVADSARFNVITILDGVQKDSQNVANISELKSNDWVIFSGTGTLTANAGSSLAGGENGTVTTSNYENYLTKIQSYNYNTIALPSTDVEAVKKIVAFVEDQRDRLGYKIQAVVNNYSEANHEGIISVDQGYKTANEVVPVISFVCYFAGLTAGSQVNESNTYHVISEAVEIINPKTDDEISEALKEGKLVLSTTRSGQVVVEKDINTLHIFTANKSYDFSKNRVIRCLDAINNDIVSGWEDTFIGKVDNNPTGLDLFKTFVLNYLRSLVNLGAILEINTDTDVTVEKGADIESVLSNIAVQPVDAMEKLYMTVLVG